MSVTSHPVRLGTMDIPISEIYVYPNFRIGSSYVTVNIINIINLPLYSVFSSSEKLIKVVIQSKCYCRKLITKLSISSADFLVVTLLQVVLVENMKKPNHAVVCFAMATYFSGYLINPSHDM